MSREDLIHFIKKVEDLQALISSLDEFPLRREQLSSCRTHDEVVALAKSWGFEIGSRWGETR